MTKPPAEARFIATHSILTLDVRHPYAAKSLIDAQDMHRTVMSGFRGWVTDGDRDARAQMGVLSTWSVDLKTGTLVLIVQSKVPGDWSGVPRAALAEKPHVITVDRTLRIGDTLTFRTVVNPTRSLPSGPSSPERTRGRRISHTRPDHVRNWFARRLQAPGQPSTASDGVVRIGATTDEANLCVRMLPGLTSPSPQKDLRILRAELRGPLTVTDPAAFTNSMSQGIGHARAYSCGLILTR
ncbi:type I-E CRISPR-associated protein Cas6/Cse3/CasE [Streptomyces sp. NPDC059575]|uniref:type I-E CRISPR-associated protein Cas6/Cse3/CasE n=1 Tax=Streptomyces sp. NPDC059575 TaxID=3346872 RepID=UPI0036C7E09A